FLTCGVGTGLAMKGKGGELGEPGKPGGTVWDQGEELVARLARPFIGVRCGRPGQRKGCLRHRILLVDQQGHCYPKRVTQRVSRHKYTCYPKPLQVRECGVSRKQEGRCSSLPSRAGECSGTS